MEIVFSIILGLIAVGALITARRQAKGRIGWVLVALAAAAQIVNLNTAYSVAVSVVTTLALIAGFFLSRRQPATPAP